MIVFDLDDTLYPERQYVLSGFRAVQRWLDEHYGKSKFLDRAAELFEQGLRGKIFNAALQACGFSDDPKLIWTLIEVYRSHPPELTLFPDAREALDRFAHAALGMITDGYLVPQQNKVAALGIAPLFQKIVFTDALGRTYWKPHERPYQEITTALGCSPEQCVYVADNPHKDFVTARKLGWRTVRVRREGGEHSLITLSPEYEADVEISSLSELSMELIYGRNDAATSVPEASVATPFPQRM